MRTYMTNEQQRTAPIEGCQRSHPHEDMSAECEQKTIAAREANRLAQIERTKDGGMNLDRLTITLPWPDTSLMPNRKNGRHWGNTQAAKVKARQDGYFGAKQAMGTDCVNLPDRIPLSIDFIGPDRRARDIDNMLACIKPQIDGIAQALGIDDKRFRPITINDGLDTQKRGFVRVEIGI